MKTNLPHQITGEDWKVYEITQQSDLEKVPTKVLLREFNRLTGSSALKFVSREMGLQQTWTAIEANLHQPSEKEPQGMSKTATAIVLSALAHRAMAGLRACQYNYAEEPNFTDATSKDVAFRMDVKLADAKTGIVEAMEKSLMSEVEGTDEGQAVVYYNFTEQGREYCDSNWGSEKEAGAVARGEPVGGDQQTPAEPPKPAAAAASKPAAAPKPEKSAEEKEAEAKAKAEEKAKADAAKKEKKEAEKAAKTEAKAKADAEKAEKKAAADKDKAEAKAKRDAEKAEKPKRSEKGQGGDKALVFNLPFLGEIKEHRPGTKRAKVIEMLTPGATLEQVMAEIGWDRKTAYEGIRLVHFYLGYGIKTEDGGVIRLITTK